MIKPSGVPRFCEELDAREGWIGLDVPKHRWVRQHVALRVAREDRRQVEAKAIDVHLSHPIAQAVDDHSPHDGVIRIQRIAAASVVGIPGAIGLSM